MTFVTVRSVLDFCVCMPFQMLPIITELRVNAVALVCLNWFGFSCYKLLYLKRFVFSCLGFGENENKQLTVLFWEVFLLFFSVQYISPF